MLTVKDWLKSKKNSEQFIPSKTTSTTISIDKAIRIKDNKEFSLLAFHKSDENHYYYDKNKDNTIKQELGILRFYEDNIHVDIVCFSRILNGISGLTDVVHMIPINDVESYYPNLVSKNLSLMLNNSMNMK